MCGVRVCTCSNYNFVVTDLVPEASAILANKIFDIVNADAAFAEVIAPRPLGLETWYKINWIFIFVLYGTRDMYRDIENF